MRIKISPARPSTSRRSSDRARSAFTLLELLAVVTIASLLAGVAMVRLQSPYRKARIEDVAQRIAFVDQQVRSHARRVGRPAALVYDLERGLVYGQSDHGDDTRHFAFAPPKSIALDRVSLPDETFNAGRVRIEVSPRGQTRSYAVAVSTPSGQRKWLLFAGLTGQATSLTTQYDVQQTLGLVHAAGIDAR